MPPELAADHDGAGITIAIVDSGVNFDHPHLRISGRGAAIVRDGVELEIRPGEHRDRYGHGTCCAALIHALAPGASLLAVRVTGDRPTTDADRLALGIEWATTQGADIVCVAMATATAIRGGLDRAVADALRAGTVVVAADAGPNALPAYCPGALAVGLREGVDAQRDGDRVVADGRARPAPAYPTNFHGSSLSTARVSACAARWAAKVGFRGEALVRGFKKALSVM